MTGESIGTRQRRQALSESFPLMDVGVSGEDSRGLLKGSLFGGLDFGHPGNFGSF